MTTERYFTLTTSDGTTLSKKFLVADGGYNEIPEKRQSEDTTLDGSRDIAQGAIYRRYEFTVKVYETAQDGFSDYGTLEDLEKFYAYNNPNGTPSNVLAMVDHFGTPHSVMFSGQLPIKPTTVILEGKDAVFFIPITLLVL